MPLQRQARRLCLYPRYEGIGESRIGVESFVHQDARYIRNE